MAIVDTSAALALDGVEAVITGADLADVQSGIGFVHNTCLLDRPQKTILRAPLAMFPKPSWFSTHRRPEALAWKLCDLYCQPSIWKLPGLFNQALRG